MQTLGSLLGVGGTGVQSRLLAFSVVTFRDGHGDSSYSSPPWALPRSESPATPCRRQEVGKDGSVVLIGHTGDGTWQGTPDTGAALPACPPLLDLRVWGATEVLKRTRFLCKVEGIGRSVSLSPALSDTLLNSLHTGLTTVCLCFYKNVLMLKNAAP